MGDTEKMNMFEEAKSLTVMLKMRNLSQNELSKMLGVSKSYVANKLRLLGLGEDMQTQIITAGLTERHARALLRLNDSEQRQRALDTICERGLSVAESEALVDLLRIGEAPKMIGQADRLKGIDAFLKSTKESLATLSSLGIKATQKVTHLGAKTMITICIDETK